MLQGKAMPNGNGRPRTRTRLTEEQLKERRQKHAQSEKNRSKRKEHEIHQMRLHVKELKECFHNLMLEKKKKRDTSLSDTLETLRLKYVDALCSCGRLREEKIFLQSRMQELHMVTDSIRTIDEDYPWQSLDLNEVETARYGYLKLPTQIRCEEIVMASYREALRFNIHAESERALGWEDQRVLCRDGREVRFLLSKIVSADVKTVEHWVERTFTSYYDYDFARKIYCTVSRQEIVEHFSEQTLLVRHSIQYIKEPQEFQPLMVASRFNTFDGYMTICRSIDGDEWEPDYQHTLNTQDEPEGDDSIDTTSRRSQMKQFYWTKFTHLGENKWELSFGGSMSNGNPQFANFMMVEIPISIMRWENLLAGPLIPLAESRKASQNRKEVDRVVDI